MTEDDAKHWLRTTFDVSRETWDRLERYVGLLVGESAHQNLIAASTLDSIWSRHIVDSAQLLKHVPAGRRGGHWVDLGSGPGLPGLVIAILSDWRLTLVESRRGRIQFLEHCGETLGLTNVDVAGCQLAAYRPTRVADIISARAFAPLPRLLEQSARLADTNTLWLLPKGRNAQSELEMIQPAWQGDFQMTQSLTSDESLILIAQGVCPKSKSHNRREKSA
jgi:16S rRNA (guanine527-N7)-methyltransferase